MCGAKRGRATYWAAQRNGNRLCATPPGIRTPLRSVRQRRPRSDQPGARSKRVSRPIEKRAEGRKMCELVRSSHTLGSPVIPVAFILKSLFNQTICEHPCDWSHTKSPSAHSHALGTTPEARFGSKNGSSGGSARTTRSRRFGQSSEGRAKATTAKGVGVWGRELKPLVPPPVDHIAHNHSPPRPIPTPRAR